MTAAEPVFIDTNVLVYVTRPTAQQHRAARSALAKLAADGCPLWISRQVLREYAAVVTRAQVTAPPLPRAEAIADIHRFERLFEVAEDSEAVFARWLDLLIAHSVSGKQVHDANLVAAMLVYGVRRLLTFNQSDFRRYRSVIAVEAAPN